MNADLVSEGLSSAAAQEQLSAFEAAHPLHQHLVSAAGFFSTPVRGRHETSVFFFVLGDLIIYYFTGIKVDILKC